MPSPLLTLPPELRLKIYALTLPHSLRLRYKPHRRTSKSRVWRKTNKHLLPIRSTTSLLLVNKLLNRETTPIFFAGNTFILDIPRYTFNSVLRAEPCLASIRNVEMRVNFGRPSAWYQARVEAVLGKELVVAKGVVAVPELRRVRFVLEGEDVFRADLVEFKVVRFLEAARMLEEVIVVCKEGKGLKMGRLLEAELGREWVRWEGEGGRWGVGMKVVHWSKMKEVQKRSEVEGV